jgi:hypothetical protein
MRVLNYEELEKVSGAGLKEELISYAIGQAIELVVNATISGVASLNQGGVPNGTDALGNTY